MIKFTDKFSSKHDLVDPLLNPFSFRSNQISILKTYSKKYFTERFQERWRVRIKEKKEEKTNSKTQLLVTTQA